jgi:signal transduction histidine kinase
MEMPRIVNYYLNFSVRLRLTVLCLCYTAGLCAVYFSDRFGQTIQTVTIISIVFLGGLFGWLNIWSIHQAIVRASQYLTDMAEGNLNQEIGIHRNNEISRMLVCMKTLQESVQKLSVDTCMLTRAAVNGDLAKRVSADRHHGDFRKIVEGINSTLDAVISPLHLAADYVDRIAKGDIPPKITDIYYGDFNVIKNNLNTCIDIMNNLLSETNRVVLAAADGRLDERTDVDLFIGGWKQLVLRVNDIVTNIVNPLRHTAELLNREVTERSKAQELLQQQQQQLEVLNRELEGRVADEVKKNREKDQALMQNDKMVSLGQLAAGVAHEINNPMAYLAGNLSILAQYFDKIIQFDRIRQESGYDESKRGMVSDSRKSMKIEYILADGTSLISESLEGTERITKIVQDLKSFARTDPMEREPVTLESCMEKALTICYNELKYVVTIRKEYGQVPVILCHPGKLNQVFLNLLVNARQAIVPPGEIVLRTWYDELFVYASVSDTGQGVPEELLPRIFDPFFTTKEEGEGTGLGLSISYDIVKKHQGELSVGCIPGKGSTFTVKLPRSHGETA